MCEQGNPFRRRLPTRIARCNSASYIVEMPELAFVTARKQQDQTTDQDLLKVYHNALIALYQMVDSSRLYYLHDEM